MALIAISASTLVNCRRFFTPPPRPLFPSPPMSLSFESESEAGRRFHEAKLILNPPQVDLKVKAGSEPVNNFPALIEILCKKTTRVHVSFYLNSYFEHKPVKMKEKRVKTTKNWPRARVRRAFLENKEHLVPWWNFKQHFANREMEAVKFNPSLNKRAVLIKRTCSIALVSTLVRILCLTSSRRRFWRRSDNKHYKPRRLEYNTGDPYIKVKYMQLKRNNSQSWPVG